MIFDLKKLATAVDESTEDFRIAKEIAQKAETALAGKSVGHIVSVEVCGKKYHVRRA